MWVSAVRIRYDFVHHSIQPQELSLLKEGHQAHCLHANALAGEFSKPFIQAAIFSSARFSLQLHFHWRLTGRTDYLAKKLTHRVPFRATHPICQCSTSQSKPITSHLRHCLHYFPQGSISISPKNKAQKILPKLRCKLGQSK